MRSSCGGVQVPEDLSVAVGLLIEKYLTELAEGRKESNRSHSDRSVLINEVKTLTEEKVRQQHHPRHMHTRVSRQAGSG